MERRDLGAFLACFHGDYRSEQPLHPERGFTGTANVRKNWTHKLRPGSDFTAELIRWTIDGDTVWAEWRWGGTRLDGAPRDERGVILYGVRDDRIGWARLYLDQVGESS
jgi:ketosteroid isomerase-like protein